MPSPDTNSNAGERARMSVNSFKNSSGIVDSLRHALAVIEERKAASLAEKILNQNKKDTEIQINDVNIEHNHRLVGKPKPDYKEDEIYNTLHKINSNEDNLFSRLSNGIDNINDKDGHNTNEQKYDKFQVSEKELLAPLCTCTFPAIKNPYFKKPNLCQAKDSVDDKLVGCLNPVNLIEMCRPAPKIMFSYMCQVHKKRLKHHHCCPICGVFCTQGEFLVCFNNIPMAPLIDINELSDEKKLKEKRILHLSHVYCATVYSQTKFQDDIERSNENLGDLSTQVSRKATKSDSNSNGSNNNQKEDKGEKVQENNDQIHCPHCWKLLSLIASKITIKLPVNMVKIEHLLPVPKRARISRSSSKYSQPHSEHNNGYSTEDNTETNHPNFLQTFNNNHPPNEEHHNNDCEDYMTPSIPSPDKIISYLRAAISNNCLKWNAGIKMASASKCKSKSRKRVTNSVTVSTDVKQDGDGNDANESLYLENLLLIVNKLAQTDINPQTISVKQKDLYQACIEADVEAVIKFLYKGSNPNLRHIDPENGRQGENALHASCISGNLIILHLLVQTGADLNAKNDYLCTPLMMAASNNYVKQIEYLIKAGACIKDQDEDGLTAFHIAAKFGNLEACKILYATKKFKINVQDNGGWTPIIWAADNKNVGVIKWLLELGADAKLTDSEGNTALHWSCFSGSVSACQLFLDTHCDINCQNERGDTPLHIASRRENRDCVLLLLSRGADTTINNNNGENSIQSCKDMNSQAWMSLKISQNLNQWRMENNYPKFHTVTSDISKGREKHAIPCVLEKNDLISSNDTVKVLSCQNFMYVSDHVQTQELDIDLTITSMTICNCEEDCSQENCSCINESGGCFYDQEGRLVSDFNYKNSPVIFECNKGCRCWNNCVNRVVQNGINCRLQVFLTPQKGWSVRTLQKILKGTFVCEYIGELISDKEADERQDDSYLFDLEYKEGDLKTSHSFCIDARFYGNVSRFLNHNCQPNLSPVKIHSQDHQDLRFPRISFFATRDISPYEELGFDYGEKFWVIKYKNFTCKCDTPACKYSDAKIFDTLAEYHKKLQMFNNQDNDSLTEDE
ncbi:unnamed protein product [Gordionus sp. m RMFG-2023]|uniref:histone-lysine N-methyltransferase EHMT1-like isoform X2 n=1 Tax=Gordionus sp. m RMFG-2023 TaxID=3053472 RepID=UPI0030E0BABC